MPRTIIHAGGPPLPEQFPYRDLASASDSAAKARRPGWSIPQARRMASPALRALQPGTLIVTDEPGEPHCVVWSALSSGGFGALYLVAPLRAELSDQWDEIAAELPRQPGIYEFIAPEAIERFAQAGEQPSVLQALKLFAPLDAGANERQAASARMRREAALLKSATEHDVGCLPRFLGQSAQPCLAIRMEYLAGVTLASVIDEPGRVLTFLRETSRNDGFLPWPMIYRIFTQLAEHLEALQALVGLQRHGDLKPDNVLLCPGADGCAVKLLDLGVAKLEDASGTDAALTQAQGGAPGSLPYVAPEVVDGQSPTGASDRFALGVMLFEATQGSRAGEVSAFQEGDGALEDRLERYRRMLESLLPACVHPEVQNALASAVLTQLWQDMTARDPQKRPSLQDIASSLGAVARYCQR